MFFLSSSGPKVSLGGRSTARESSREELLERSRIERQKRQRKKDEERAALVVQVRSEEVILRQVWFATWLVGRVCQDAGTHPTRPFKACAVRPQR
jgi:hypothetical protein